MRYGLALLALTLSLPIAAGSQAPRRPRDVEKFEVSGLPQSPASDLEREIFQLLKAHRKGDLTDATRIHARLAQYYKERGDEARTEACERQAMRAWEAASGERAASAGSPSTPPFDSEGTLAASFAYIDEALQVEHVWDFYEDGTYAHEVNRVGDADLPGPRERGWYTLKDDRMRLWQYKPRMDKTVSFVLSGERGKDGATMAGVVMTPKR